MKAYGRTRQHPKGYKGLGLPKGLTPWWEGEALPEKGRGRKENKKEIELQVDELEKQKKEKHDGKR